MHLLQPKEFNDVRRKKADGFTLLELLIVLGIIGIIAGAVLVAVDPVKRIQESRDARRHSEANALLNALLNHQVDYRAYFPGDTSTTASSGANGAPIIESSTKAQVVVRSVSGVDCDGASTRPLCTQLPSGYSLDESAGAPALQCVAKLDVAVAAPVAAVAALAAGTGVTPGTHSYKVTFVTSLGETDADAGAVSNTVTTVNVTAGFVDLTGIVVAPAASGVLSRKIYRTIAGAAATGPWQLLTTISNNTATTYQDTTADGALGANAPTVNITGLVPTYIAELPIDTSTTVNLSSNLALGANNTGYFVIRHPTSKRVTVGACYGEQNTAIRVTR